MLLLSCRGIRKSFGSLDVLKGLDLDINEGERIGIVGRNGAGKTTLAEIIFGCLQPDAGTFIRGRPRIETGYLLQSASYKIHVYGGDGSYDAGDSEGADFVRIAGCLGIDRPQSWNSDRLEGLSGGERTKLSLAGILSHKPDLLILDEPTNHLDFMGVNWLSAELAKYRGTILVISHDRYFLDLSVQRIVEVENGAAVNYNGNYSFYRKEKVRLFENRSHQYDEQVKRKKMISDEIDRVKMWSAKSHRDAGKTGKMAENKMGAKEFYRIAAKRMDKRAKSKIKRLQRMETEGIAKPVGETTMNFMFENSGKHGKRILEAKDLEKKYGDRVLFRDCSFYMLHGDRIGLVGPNGCGKSTLLRIIMGEENADAGELWVSSSAEIAYINQDVTDMNPGEKPLEILKALPGMASERVHTTLACLGIERQMMNKTIECLSMGERMRIKLAAAILQGKGFLVLDEPTNHLDLYSRERLEEALEEYQGTLLLVSHDRYMMEKVCSKLLIFENHGITPFQGGFSDYTKK